MTYRLFSVLLPALAILALLPACEAPDNRVDRFTGAAGEVKLVTLDPGHFHAALVQKSMYGPVSPVVRVYAPEGPDVRDHLDRIEGFNTRAQNPTAWEEIVYTGDDYLARMIQERQGNVVLLSGNNRKKAEYIRACAEAGLNVLADKPMCIDAAGFRLLEKAFELARKKGLLVWDIMTERFEVTSLVQKVLVNDPAVFGEPREGTREDPAVVKESVHHFCKFVSGSPLKRPPWFFDTTQEGEGLVDVTTHLVDLVMTSLFPGEALNYDKDVTMLAAKRWPTLLTKEQFREVTKLEDFPDYLQKDLDNEGRYPCFANGEMHFTLRGIHARIAVRWKFKAPEGALDTHFSRIRGSRAVLLILQGEDQGYQPELYVEPAPGAGPDALEEALNRAVQRLQKQFAGLALERRGARWHVVIPPALRVGHETHFRQVTERYLDYLRQGKLPDWEVPDMLVKYRITTEALALAGQGEND